MRLPKFLRRGATKFVIFSYVFHGKEVKRETTPLSNFPGPLGRSMAIEGADELYVIEEGPVYDDVCRIILERPLA